MVHSERAKVFMDHNKNDHFDDKDKDQQQEEQQQQQQQDDTNSNTSDSDTILTPPNLYRLISTQSHSYPQLSLPKGRRRHCSEGEVAVKEKVKRYRNRSVSDKDLEQVLGAAAWLLALADNNNCEAPPPLAPAPPQSATTSSTHNSQVVGQNGRGLVEGDKEECGSCRYYVQEERRGVVQQHRGICGSAVDVSTLSVTPACANMKGWGLSHSGHHHRLTSGVPAARSASCNTSPSKQQAAPLSSTSSSSSSSAAGGGGGSGGGGRPLNKYAAILASVGCTPPSVAPCPLSLLSVGPHTGNRKIDHATSSTTMTSTASAVTWAHHSCCTASTVTTTSHSKASMMPRTGQSGGELVSSPGSTKGIGSKSCSINLKTFSASFNCRTTSNILATSPTTAGNAKRSLSNYPLTSAPPVKAGTETKSPVTGISLPKAPEGNSDLGKTCKGSLKSSSKSSPSGSRKAKSSPKTSRSGRSDSTRSKKSSKSNLSKLNSHSSSKSSSSSSVATIDCETVSVNIPDRPMCVMTTSWTPDDDLMSPMSWTCERQPCNQNDSPSHGSMGAQRFERSWPEPVGYIVDNSSVKYQGSILHSDSLSSEADEENNKMSASQKLRASLRDAKQHESQTTSLNDETSSTTTSSQSSTSNTSPAATERRKPRPLSLPSNHKLDLKLCYFDPNTDTGLNDNSDLTLQRSSVDLEFDLPKVKRHSSGLSKACSDRWHSALHPLIHSQSQILQESELSKVAKVKILSRTSWCECSQEFLMTSLNSRHRCPSDSPPSPAGGKEEDMSSSSHSSLARNENGSLCQCKDGESCSCCHGNRERRGGGGEDTLRIPKAPSDEFLTEAMKYTRDKLKHRCGEDLVTLLEQFYKQIQSVSEELVVLLQERHDLHEQVDMRKIAIEQLVRLQNEAAAANDVNSIQMSVILPSHHSNQR